MIPEAGGKLKYSDGKYEKKTWSEVRLKYAGLNNLKLSMFEKIIKPLVAISLCSIFQCSWLHRYITALSTFISELA